MGILFKFVVKASASLASHPAPSPEYPESLREKRTSELGPNAGIGVHQVDTGEEPLKEREQQAVVKWG